MTEHIGDKHDETDDKKMKRLDTPKIELVNSGETSKMSRINLSFFKTNSEDPDFCYPPSYYTLSSKERLLLLYAENFRNSFVRTNYNRRPLVLALPNECNIQKFVCTTIRPTSFLHIPLIRTAEEIASFVADFITYEPLEDKFGYMNKTLHQKRMVGLIAVCEVCGKKVKGSLRISSNFIKHLKKEHPQKFSAFKLEKEDNKQITGRKCSFSRDILNFICNTTSPLSIVSDPSFKKLFPGKSIPSRRSITRLLVESQHKSIQKIDIELSKTEYDGLKVLILLIG